MSPVGRSRFASLALVASLGASALLYRRELVRWFTGPEVTTHSGAQASSSSEIDHYTCPMHPSIAQKTPGKCPICGMALVPVMKEEERAGVVMIDEARRQLGGVRTAPVALAPMKQTIRAVGTVAYDESALSDVNLKVRGWITHLSVNQTGQRVARGQTLFTMYSPELYNAEQDFLLASQGTPLLAHASRQRLHLLGLDDAAIDAIAKKGKPDESVTISAPAAGYVTEKNVVEGASVEPGTRLFRIAALDKVWVEADVYEADLARVHPKQVARVTLDYLPGQAYDAVVAYVYPYLDPKARTGRVRFELANRRLQLLPGMYARIEIDSDLGPQLQVPVSAVVYTGPRRIVFVDLGEGRFRSEEVGVGAESDGMLQIARGLHEGDVVATSGVFLIAAEARIRTATKYWNAEDGGAP